MEDSDAASPAETIGEQMKAVTRLTTKSHVTITGDASIASEPLVRFEGSDA